MSKPLPWKTVITRAEKSGHFSELAKSRIGDWKSCFVSEYVNVGEGQGYAISGRYPRLYDLGLLAINQVASDHVRAAKRLYNQVRKAAVEYGLA